MTEILQWTLCWFGLGIVGWIAGTIIDYIFYGGKKPVWKMLFLCTVLGPIIWLVIMSVLTNTWMDIRKKKSKSNKCCSKDGLKILELQKKRQQYQDHIDILGPIGKLTTQNYRDFEILLDSIEDITKEIGKENAKG